MKRYSNRHLPRLITEISLAPLVDLVLVLMFVFVLAAPLLKNEPSLLSARGMRPQPAAAPAPQSSVRLFVFKDGSVTLDGAMLPRTNLPSALKELAAKRPEVGVELRMHRALDMQQLAEMMDMLKEAGVNRTAIATHADEP